MAEFGSSAPTSGAGRCRRERDLSSPGARRRTTRSLTCSSSRLAPQNETQVTGAQVLHRPSRGGTDDGQRRSSTESAALRAMRATKLASEGLPRSRGSGSRHFRFILTVNNPLPSAPQADGLLRRVLRDAVEKTFRGARGRQGVFASTSRRQDDPLTLTARLLQSAVREGSVHSPP